MNKKSSIIITALIAVIIIGAILFSVFHKPEETPTISLPKPDSESGVGGENGLLSVNPKTVQAALGNLSRTEAYSREYKITSFWENGESTAAVKVWKNGDLMRIDHKQGKLTKSTLFTGDMVYRWYDDSAAVVSAPISEYDRNTLDRYARLITYEELADVPIERITAADYEQKLGENCIYTEYESEDGRYVNHMYVSVSNGLLVAAEILEDGKIIYSMSSVVTNPATPEDDIFIPPAT
ncbi:MAG: hypothetical protein GXY26_03455 [Clostridiales bacterium]|jgi:hypothetical protein|nr:hypothetical protein [Clostridiales bacterium]